MYYASLVNAKYYVQMCKKLQLLGDFVPRAPTGALPLDHTGGLRSTDP